MAATPRVGPVSAIAPHAGSPDRGSRSAARRPDLGGSELAANACSSRICASVQRRGDRTWRRPRGRPPGTLEDAGLVGVQLQHPAVAAQADAVERVEHRGRREVGVGRRRHRVVEASSVMTIAPLGAAVNAATGRTMPAPDRRPRAAPSSPSSSLRDGWSRPLARPACCACRARRRPQRGRRGRCELAAAKPSCLRRGEEGS